MGFLRLKLPINMANVAINHVAEILHGRYSDSSSGCRSGSAFVLRMVWLFACICVFCNVSAQSLSLSGNVMDEHGNCLSDVYLIAINPETSEVLTATASDDYGKYVLPSAPSRFILNITRIGYASQNITINCEADLNAIQTIRMQVAATQLEEVTVTADAPRIQREVGKFVIRNIASSPFAKGSRPITFFVSCLWLI